MSNLLKEFYRAYKNWLDDGAPEFEPFIRYSGLCVNLELFCDNAEIDSERYSTEMLLQFRKASLCDSYPFGKDAYKVARLEETQHLNPLRIKWVEEHAA